jgi:hypothetical protein
MWSQLLEMEAVGVPAISLGAMSFESGQKKPLPLLLQPLELRTVRPSGLATLVMLLAFRLIR